MSQVASNRVSGFVQRGARALAAHGNRTAMATIVRERIAASSHEGRVSC